MPFIGRVRETQVAEEDIAARGGSARLFIGEPGIGKTRLARELAERHDTVVMSARPDERMWPYSGLSAAAAALGGARGTAVDGLLARGRDWPEHLLAEELNRTLHLVHDEPAILLIDDLDELDSASVTVLSFVFARLRGTGLTVLATARGSGDHGDFTGMALTRIRRLPFDESVDLARSVLGTNTAVAVLYTVAEVTAGHPGTIVRVRLTPREAVGDHPLPLPLRLAEDRTRRRGEGRQTGDPCVASLMDLVAIGPVFDHDRLALVAADRGLDLDALIHDGLLSVHAGLVRIADPARRLRHLAALSTEERRHLHVRSAQEHEGAYPAACLWHMSLTEPGADLERLLIAAVDLARSGDHLAAIEFAERGLTGEVDPAARCRHLIDLGEALVLQGQDVQGRHYLARAGRSADPGLRARAALARLRATAAIEHVVDETALTVAVEADSDDGRTAEHVLCESALLHLWHGDPERARELVVTAVDRGVAAAETALVARLLDELGADTVTDLTIDTGVGTGPAGADPPIELQLLDLRAGIMREEYAGVRRRIRWLLDRTPRLAPLWRDHLLCLLVTTEVRGGDPLGAREAVAAWRREWIDGRTVDVATILVLASAAALDPLDERAHSLVHQGRELCRREGRPTLLPWFAVIEGQIALAEGRYHDAVTSLREGRDGVGADDPALTRADADLIEALWLSGDPADAQVELRRLEHAARRSPRRWTTLALARSRAVCASDRDAVSAFREAETVYRTDDAPSERRLLARARERCLTLDERARPRIPAGDATHGRSLTAQERDVIALVEKGMRNREIAASLFLSLRTVELRLTGIYRKLGVSSRAHLMATLHNAAG
ncbi:DNA-binding CsgD family transcriptional regulator [Microbacterium sp. 1154]|uniref:helix-turn-helix transcriptional regulator n=1 Tax=Microbacterium sp. 1154 TaxID=2817733 RepID=UPI002854CCAC|nr:LuxR C-terminal-related transcriptional regulator [Microbacterium sp. 1154]MDR6692313.1 DNA-binding CsgD family transcriptional regulator [Microbacterium sp. 1154]